jgi:hypothetical protein
MRTQPHMLQVLVNQNSQGVKASREWLLNKLTLINFDSTATKPSGNISNNYKNQKTARN